MNINDKLTISFFSSNEENLLYCTVIDINEADNNLYLAECYNFFKANDLIVKYIIIYLKNSNKADLYYIHKKETAGFQQIQVNISKYINETTYIVSGKIKEIKNLRINDKLKIGVAEPWNFTSSDGDNTFYCTIIDINNNKKGKPLYLAKNNSVFKVDNFKVNYIIFYDRNYFDSVNMHYINENDIQDFQEIHNNTKKYINDSTFIIIGTIMEIKRKIVKE
ncbi:MAG: hypothetical protein GYA50_01615 [Eubacteriaceae bacterium]|nr:hypothetical protein [Eubacteriaceae bacterium]